MFNETVSKRCDYPDYMYEVGPGWVPLVNDLALELEAIWPDYTIAQIKEKFGELRFYADLQGEYTNDVFSAFHEAIRSAEERSVTTCDECGEPGTCGSVGNSMYYATRCEAHNGRNSGTL